MRIPIIYISTIARQGFKPNLFRSKLGCFNQHGPGFKAKVGKFMFKLFCPAL